MKSSLFIPAWYDDVCSVIGGIERGLSSKFGVCHMRSSLERTRDELHDITAGFDVPVESDAGEEIYRDLFDALSLLTLALQARPANRGLMVEAVQLLRQRRDKTIL